jgi:hypothetical protein
MSEITIEEVTAHRARLFPDAELWTLIDALDALEMQSNWGQYGEALYRELAAELVRREEKAS